MTKVNPIYHEIEVLAHIAQGDPEAFRQLFDQYKDKVYAYAMHYTRQNDLSEELVQEVFLKVWLHREELPKVERFEAWIFTICRNLCFNQLRRIARQENLHKGVAARSVSVAASADELLLSREYQDLLKKAVDRLPPQQKIVYTLHKEQYQSLDDIAGQLGLSRNTVKGHLAVALRSIRTFIRSYREMASLLALWWINR